MLAEASPDHNHQGQDGSGHPPKRTSRSFGPGEQEGLGNEDGARYGQELNHSKQVDDFGRFRHF